MIYFVQDYMYSLKVAWAQKSFILLKVFLICLNSDLPPAWNKVFIDYLLEKNRVITSKYYNQDVESLYLYEHMYV